MSKGIFNIFKIIIIASLILFIVILAFWVIDKNNGVLIQSFEVSGMNNVSSKSIEDLLNCNIDDITALEFIGQKTTSNERGVPSEYNLNLAVGDESLEKSLLAIGNVGVEGTSFSLGNLVLAIKGLVGREPNSISGSFQKYDSTLSLIAILKDRSADKVEVWEVKKNLSNGNQSIESLVPDMIKDLAFQFVHERCRNGDTSGKKYPRTWEAYKSLINARTEYSRYSYTNNESHLNKSIEFVESIREKEPRFAGSKELKLLWDLSLALIEKNRTQDVESLYMPIVKIVPFRSNMDLGSIHGRMRDYKVALRYFNNSTQINPLSFDAWLYKGLTHEKIDQHEAAINSYKKAIDIDSKSERAWNNIGWNFYQMHKYPEALEAFEKSRVINGSYAIAWNNKGLVHKDEQDYKLAMNAFELATRYDPKFSQPWNNKGEIYYKKGEYEDALKSYDTAISLNSEYAAPWNNKGLTFDKLNLQYEALEAYNRSILLDPNWANPWNGKGNVLREQGKMDEAIDAYERAIALDDKWATPWYNKGNVLREQGKMDEAIEAYKKAKNLHKIS